jgi:hypothetical protein
LSQTGGYEDDQGGGGSGQDDYYSDEYGEEEYGEDDNGDGNEEEQDYDPFEHIVVCLPTYEHCKRFVETCAPALANFIADNVMMRAKVVLGQAQIAAKNNNTNVTPMAMQQAAFESAATEVLTSIADIAPRHKAKLLSDLAQSLCATNAPRTFMTALQYAASQFYQNAENYMQIPYDVTCGAARMVYIYSPNGNNQNNQSDYYGAGGGRGGGGHQNNSNNASIRLEQFALDCIRQFIFDYELLPRRANNQYQLSYGNQPGQQQPNIQGNNAALITTARQNQGILLTQNRQRLDRALEAIIEKELDKYVDLYTTSMPDPDAAQYNDTPTASTRFLGIETQKRFEAARLEEAMMSHIDERTERLSRRLARSHRFMMQKQETVLDRTGRLFYELRRGRSDHRGGSSRRHRRSSSRRRHRSGHRRSRRDHHRRRSSSSRHGRHRSSRHRSHHNDHHSDTDSDASIIVKPNKTAAQKKKIAAAAKKKKQQAAEEKDKRRRRHRRSGRRHSSYTSDPSSSSYSSGSDTGGYSSGTDGSMTYSDDTGSRYDLSDTDYTM